eukprot:scaffold301599_cov19-Tisochrysis_lutea.AAC.1
MGVCMKRDGTGRSCRLHRWTSQSLPCAGGRWWVKLMDWFHLAGKVDGMACERRSVGSERMQWSQTMDVGFEGML